jgi:hypothetical protein
MKREDPSDRSSPTRRPPNLDDQCDIESGVHEHEANVDRCWVALERVLCEQVQRVLHEAE